MITPKKEQSPAPGSAVSSSTPMHNGSADDSHAESDPEADNHSTASGGAPQNLSSSGGSLSGKDAKRSNRKYENDDIPQEMVARIYQEELAKLMGQRVEESFRQQQYDRTHEEIRQALSIYHQELSRLSQLALTPGHEFARFGAALPGALLNGAFPGLSLGPEARSTGAGGARGADPAADALRHHGAEQRSCRSTSLNAQLASRDWHKRNKYSSAFSLVRPGLKFPTNSGSTPTQSPPGGGVLALSEASAPGGVAEDLGSSPLQRMQSITNSLLSQTSTPAMPASNQRQARAVLPPITQQQFDQYNNLNTEDIVKKVKEQLSQYSISQRLFGENVLGLSQGSVSDLLARPKPWHMLTQKGREPFIRMKIFLEDENAVHKLVASQYKIAPEKLMRTSGFTAATNPLAGSSKLPPTSAAARARDLTSPSQSHRNSHCDSGSSPLLSKGGYNTTGADLQVALLQDCPSPGVPLRSLYQPPSSPSALAAARKGHHHPSIARSLAYVQPSVYEMAALTTDLDTQTITAKIKETLMAHNIGQKIFGEAVLGLSQGSVSELLSKPKPWHMLSIKGREPFIRMQLWLNDPHNVEKLQVIKNERREANKRRRTHVDLEVAPRPVEPHPTSMPGNPAGNNFPFAPPSSPFPAAKKPRVLFSDEQKEALRLAFSMDPYPSTATIEFLASELSLSVRTITNWFHNHRMRLKQHVVSPNPDDSPRGPSDLLSPLSTRDGSSTSFDPALFRGLLVQRLAEIQGDKGMGPSAFGGGNSNSSGNYSIYNSYSPSSQGNDEGTLDLSMSSQSLVSRRDRSSAAGGGDCTPTEEDDSNLSQEEAPTTAGSDRDSLHDESLARKNLNSHSRRRKPAAPKWVDPGLSPDSDDNDEEGDEDGEEEMEEEESAIINGVCVRQTASDFGLRTPTRETVRVDPVAAVDDLARKRLSETSKSEAAPEEEEEEEEDGEGEEQGALELCTTTKRAREELQQQHCRSDSIKKLEQRLDRDERSEDWEF